MLCEPFQRCSMMGMNKEIEELTRKRSVAKGKFTRKTNLFTRAHGNEAPVTVLHGIYEEIESVCNNVEGISENQLSYCVTVKERI